MCSLGCSASGHNPSPPLRFQIGAMSTAAVPTVMAALSSDARGAPLALTACRLRRIQLSMSNAKYVSTRGQAVQLWLLYAINCYWENFCMESLLEAEVPGTAMIDLNSTGDRREGQGDVRLDEAVGRAMLAFFVLAR